MVAVLRFGAAGDVVRIAPAVEALAAAWPHARILVVTHARFAPLLAGLRVPAQIVALPTDGRLWALARQLRTAGVTDVLDLHGNLRARLLSACLWPRRVVHWQKRTWTEWARVRLAHAPHRPQQTCGARQQMAVQRLTGQRSSFPPLRLGAPSPPNRTPAARRVGLSPGAAWATKRWPTAHWSALAQALVAHGIQVDIFGSDGERMLVEAVGAAAPLAHRRTGLSWTALRAAMTQLDVFVCADSGPLHLATALGVPSVGLFFSTSPHAYDDVATRTLAASMACAPCSFYGRATCPRGHAACVTQLGVARVFAVVQQLLHDAVTPRELT